MYAGSFEQVGGAALALSLIIRDRFFLRFLIEVRRVPWICIDRISVYRTLLEPKGHMEPQTHAACRGKSSSQGPCQARFRVDLGSWVGGSPPTSPIRWLAPKRVLRPRRPCRHSSGSPRSAARGPPHHLSAWRGGVGRSQSGRIRAGRGLNSCPTLESPETNTF